MIPVPTIEKAARRYFEPLPIEELDEVVIRKEHLNHRVE